MLQMRNVKKDGLGGMRMDGSDARGRASSTRMLAALDLFSVERPVISAMDIGAELSLPRATTYRHLKTLCEAGLLLRLGNSDFCLGPRIVQLDRQIQLSDPLIAASRAPMVECLRTQGWDGMLLCSFVRDFVLCTHQEVRPGSEIQLKRARGIPFPMFHGPASLIIAAHLPIGRVRELYIRALEEDGASARALGPDWDSARKRLRAIKQRGFVVSQNEFQTGMTGVSAPIFDSKHGIVGSVSAVLGPAVTGQDEAKMGRGILDCARTITDRLEKRIG
ncbi:MAG: hypothetical protein DI556_15305 [Rhodovulum sulfidophilum]|uniref:IclR family transcriptional regulator n=1 Tax=Rhodovulum sulfidophilum TaxID=35806 RepID=A0A2W5PTV0_RHOSU|nr:MAG: hypothetical protein DI556_15305 [Rhodovulum sulfidophilum]